MALKIFIHYPQQGRNMTSRIGDFLFLPELGLHVYQGRSLSLDEFEKIQPKLFGSGNLVLPPMIKIVEEDAAEPAAESLPEGVTVEDIQAMVAEIDRLRGEVGRLIDENAVLLAEKAATAPIVEAPTEEKPEEKLEEKLEEKPVKGRGGRSPKVNK